MEEHYVVPDVCQEFYTSFPFRKDGDSPLVVSSLQLFCITNLMTVDVRAREKHFGIGYRLTSNPNLDARGAFSYPLEHANHTFLAHGHQLLLD